MVSLARTAEWNAPNAAAAGRGYTLAMYRRAPSPRELPLTELREGAEHLCVRQRKIKRAAERGRNLTHDEHRYGHVMLADWKNAHEVGVIRGCCRHLHLHTRRPKHLAGDMSGFHTQTESLRRHTASRWHPQQPGKRRSGKNPCGSNLLTYADGDLDLETLNIEWTWDAAQARLALTINDLDSGTYQTRIPVKNAVETYHLGPSRRARSCPHSL